MTFWIPPKLYEPLIFGSVSPTEETEDAGLFGLNKELTPSRIKEEPIVVNNPPTPPVKREAPIVRALFATKLNAEVATLEMALPTLPTALPIALPIPPAPTATGII